MKLITRETDYALRALCFIAKRKKKVFAVTELSSQLRVPRPFLRKILQSLNKEGILNSTRGRGGGFLLARSPRKISLTGIMRVFQGELKFNACTLNKLICPNLRRCPLRKSIARIERYVLGELHSITLASLVKQ